jgi:hypothetical protein
MKKVPGPRWFLLILWGMIVLAGYFGPWVPHRAAGLVILGSDLPEYVKFLPAVASGQVALRREVFYLPLLTGSVTAGLLASRRDLPLSIRILLGLAAIVLAPALLPPAWSPTTLQNIEFRLQVIALAVSLVLPVVAPLVRYLPDRLVLAIISLLAIMAALLPASGFLRVRPVIADLYREALPLGWGFWACLCGNLLLALCAVAEMLPRRRLPYPHF